MSDEELGSGEIAKPDEIMARMRSVLESAETILLRLQQLQASSETIAATKSELNNQVEAILLESKGKLSEVQAIAAQIAAAQAQVTSDQAVIATKSDHIQKAQEHADRVRSNLDRELTSAKAQQAETEGFRARAQSAVESVSQVVAEMTALKAGSDKDAAAIVENFESSKEAALKTKVLAEKAEGIETAVTEYESKLDSFSERCEEQLVAIESLLPGATSAGLAHAFNERRRTFIKPGVHWQWLFVGSVIALVVLAATGLWHVYRTNDVLTYDALIRLWLARLPIAGALIWLALYASRESALAKRLEEDYGYKAAVAASFQGFHKQMTEVTAAGDTNSPAMKLCADTLHTIASPPGRIYDKHALIVSPTGELKDAAKTVVDAVKN